MRTREYPKHCDGVKVAAAQIQLLGEVHPDVARTVASIAHVLAHRVPLGLAREQAL